jgi:hypothetical protein
MSFEAFCSIFSYLSYLSLCVALRNQIMTDRNGENEEDENISPDHGVDSK